jgi:peptidylprolyl isomerase
VRLAMGFEKEILQPGDDEFTPLKGQTVTVHCTGFGKNRDLEEVFWSTKDAGQEPFSFQIGTGQVIRAWDEAVMTMGLGETAEVTCTPDYAYGAGGFPAWGIMPNSHLRFEIEVLNIE